MATEVSAPPSQNGRARPAVLAFLVWLAARFIGLTLRMRYENGDLIQRVSAEQGGAIIACWHGRTLIVANVFRKRRYLALISLSRDGEVQNRIFQRFGFRTVRGSTGRGGARAAIQLIRMIREGSVLAFTPDGPRGPTHVVQQGTILLAQRSGRPVIPIGTSAMPRKILPTWDSYLIPRPFGRGAFVAGEPIFVPADLDDAGKEAMAVQIGLAITACEERAEALAQGKD